ncbi:MAG: arylsulfatase [Opitutaceae bacterium]
MQIEHPANVIRGLLIGLISAVAAHLSLAADAAFKGKIAPSVTDSVPDWPQPTKAPAGAPNIVLILLDDIGFADTSTFGGVAQTPELDKLAARGLRYNNFNTTAMCSPTRAALLTGRNHHRVGFGVAESSGGFPGYNFVWKQSTVSIAEVLRRNGYSTGAFGKWHNTPVWEISPIGPFDHWPTSLGFECFYGFMAGMENQWEPSRLYRNTTPVEPPATPQQGYHFTTDITNEAIRWVQTHVSLAPGKPYFLYFAPGAVHMPHHAPKEWIERYRGRFDQGWDKLREEIFARQKQLGVIPANAEPTPRPAEIPAWDSLAADQKKFYARQMEVYAGFVAHTDHELGRLLRAVQQLPGGDNTLILYIVGDNGSCGECGLDGITDGRQTAIADQLQHIDELGGPQLPSNIYSAGWAWLGSTPFQWWKEIASHFGGVRDPLIVSWPAHIKDCGGLRSQFTHVNDVAATLYEVTGIPFPAVVDGIKQQPLDGVSFVQTFDHPEAPSRHRIQYFEMLGNRAIYQDGWVAAARHWMHWDNRLTSDYTHDRWELYNVDEDFSEAHDRAVQFPGKVKELQELFDAEARRNDVYPLGGVAHIPDFDKGKPSLTDHKGKFVYYPGIQRLPMEAIPSLSGKSYRITASAVIPDTGAQGVIVSYGGRGSGFAFYLKDDQLFYENNPLNGMHEVIASKIRVPRGNVVLSYEFIKEGVKEGSIWGEICSGTGRLLVNGQAVGEAKLSGVIGSYFGSWGIGQAFGSPVSDAFQPPFRFTGTLTKVEMEVQ